MQKEEGFKKILVPTDGSLPSIIAQELTVFIAKKFNSKVTVFHVVSHELMNPRLYQYFPEIEKDYPLGISSGEISIARNIPTPPSASSLPPAVATEITNSYHQRGEEILDGAEALFKEENIPVDKKLIEHHDPADTILKEAKKGNYDLIVMGNAGEKEKEPHLGSVAAKVSHHAETPVLIARGNRQISKILVPVDGSEKAEKSLKYASAIAKKTDAQMTLLYVQESGIFKLRPEVSKKIGTNILSKAAEQAKGVKLDQKLESGDPAQVITETANKENYDIIVMGARGHSMMEHFRLGSVSNHVIHYAKDSVLITK